MSQLALAGLAVATFLVAALLTGRLRGYALKRSLVDHPNARGAHDAPTPRGGGLAIVIAFLAALAVLAGTGAMSWAPAVGIGGGGLIVALVGFRDDHGHVPARWRLLAHFIGAAWLLAWIGAVPAIPFLESWGVPAAAAHAIAAILIVWLINLYNFMDGIDGIASVEAVTSALGAALILMLTGGHEFVAPHLLFAAAVLGFLIWNWPPASIFMGDVASGFLGIVSAGLALWLGLVDPALLFAWLILLALFIVDSGLTLLRRALRGERIYEAHRMHGYQRAARRLGAHAPVTVAVALINAFWLWPVAAATALHWVEAPTGLAVAYLPILGLALWWGSGAPETTLASPSPPTA